MDGRRMTKEQKQLLAPHAEHYSAMYDHIAEASDDELAQLTAACLACTTTNCWWANYNAAQYLLKEIRAEIGVRARRTAAEAAPHRHGEEIRWADDGGRQAA